MNLIIFLAILYGIGMLMGILKGKNPFMVSRNYGATTTLLDLNLLIPEFQEVSNDMGAKWQNGLTVNAALMNDRRKAKIGNDGDYGTKVAAPSTAGFVPMIDSGFISRKGRSATDIGTVHAKNAAGAFQKWNDGLDLAFATEDGVVAKAFVRNVQNKSGNLERAIGAKTLRFTGDKIRGRGPAPTIAEWLLGYNPAIGWLRPGDTLTAGSPYKIVAAGLESAFKAALVQQLIKNGMAIVNADYNATIMTAKNTELAAFLSAIHDATLCDDFVAVPAADKSSCIFVRSAGVLTLNTVIHLTV